MNTKTAEILCTINSEFYRENADSFSQTRSAAWPGWSRCIDVLAKDGLEFERGPHEQDLAVFDLACGNLRFEAFLKSAFPDTNLALYAVDNCDVLVPQTPAVNFQCLDVLDILLSDGSAGSSSGADSVNGGNANCDINGRFAAPLCDLSVSFGFLHHVPMAKYRIKVLESLIRQTRCGGFVIVSLWQFLNNPKLAEKAQTTHRLALQELGLPELDANDYLLGWKDISGQYRYCHSFTETEIEQLATAVADKATLISRFVSDGRSNNLNSYLILKVK